MLYDSSFKLAFLGTGLMGNPMARNLAKNFKTSVWNRSPAKAETLRDVASVVASPEEAVLGADIVVMMLLDGLATSNLLKDHALIEKTSQNALIINMGSVDPSCDKSLFDHAKLLGRHYMDAPVSGGVKGAQEGNLVIFAGGLYQDFVRASPLFTILGTAYHMGSIGSGQIAKLANQLIVAITIGAVAEALLFAEALGCNKAILQQALQGGFADSHILKIHGARMIEEDFVPGGRAIAQLKDLDNALFLEKEYQLSLPLGNCVHHGFHQLVTEEKGGDLDHSAYYLWLKNVKKSSIGNR